MSDLASARQPVGGAAIELERVGMVFSSRRGPVRVLRDISFSIRAAEFIAADSGLGFLINDARTFFLVANMLLGAAVIGAIGFTFNTLLRRAEARLLRWRKDARG